MVLINCLFRGELVATVKHLQDNVQLVVKHCRLFGSGLHSVALLQPSALPTFR